MSSDAVDVTMKAVRGGGWWVGRAASRSSRLPAVIALRSSDGKNVQIRNLSAIKDDNLRVWSVAQLLSSEGVLGHVERAFKQAPAFDVDDLELLLWSSLNTTVLFPFFSDLPSRYILPFSFNILS